MMRLPLGSNDDGPERRWFDDDATAVEDRPADFAASLVSLGFIRAALRRGAWFWRVAAVIGLLVGFGLYVVVPPGHQASTTLLLTIGPESVPGTAILDDQAIAHSHTVASLAMHKLGLRQSVSSFLGSYTASVVTDRVLLITARAPSNHEAVSRANTLATEFLKFRADRLQALQRLQFAVSDQQITQDKQHIKSISDQISQLSAQPASSSQQAKLSALQAQRDRANRDLTALEQTASANQATTQVTTASMVGESKVLDVAAPIDKSPKKRLLLYMGGGLLAGLALGLGIVMVRALVSDRLRRRDDVAHALGAPVKLSVPAIRVSRWLPGRRGLAAARSPEVRRIVAHLGSAVPHSSGGPASLAVVPVDDVQVPAVCLVSLAVACAQQGMQVVVADLCRGAPAARLLGTTDPGVQAVSVHDTHLVVALPEPDDVVPVGPLHRGPRRTQATQPLAAAASASADLLLTLAALDPSLGGEHLATWATDAVVVMTAGRSSWAKIHGVGEMIRLAGTRLVSAVLVGADKTDESLGLTHTPVVSAVLVGADKTDESLSVTHAPGAGRNAVAKESLHSDAEGSFVTADGGSGARRPTTGDPPRRIRVSGVPRP
jgi:capsular polysaccharide biosynthesis protein